MAAENWDTIGPDNGLPPVWWQAISGNNADYCQLDHWEQLNEILIEIQTFQIREMD